MRRNLKLPNNSSEKLFKGALNITVRRYQFIFLSLFCFACSKQDEVPQQFSSYDYRMDGSRFVPNIGVPSNVTLIDIPATIPSWAKDSMYYDFFEIPPVWMLVGGEYHYLLANGRQGLFTGNERNSKIIYPTATDDGNITNILTDALGVYIIYSTGSIEAYDTASKLRWNYRGDAFGVNPGNAILADTELIIAGANTVWNHLNPLPTLTAYNIHTGDELWRIDSMSVLQSFIYDSQRHQIIAASDSSIMCFSLDRKVKSYVPIHQSYTALHLRIISNLCLCGINKDKIAFGYLSKRSGSDERTMNVGIFTANSKDGSLQKISSHEVSYLPVNIASNGPMILASGFYDSGSELTCGIDAFYTDDTTKLWQRRFTYPLAAPVAISEKNAYFTLTFSTQAQVPAQSIFYTLDLSTGKTLGELPVTGAQNGFAPGIPMPIRKSGFMLADRNKPVIYILKP
jgi:outer membrane protein assembly factor BamB